jgi:hypothetical protein
LQFDEQWHVKNRHCSAAHHRRAQLSCVR